MLKAKSLGRYAIGCDDPFQRKCNNETSARFSEAGAWSLAMANGWSHNSDTLEDACPTCVSLQKDLIKSRKALGKIPREEKTSPDITKKPSGTDS